MSKEIFLLLNVALAFYNVGTIWACEIDIFRSWALLNEKTFHAVQTAHWRKIPYWIFTPVGAAFAGTIALFWYHPANIPVWEIWVVFLVQLLSHLLTAIFWGPWQAKLAKDELGSSGPWLRKILKTHWIRTLLINLYALMLLRMAIQAL